MKEATAGANGAPVQPFEARTVEELAAEAPQQAIQRLVAGVTVTAGAPNAGKSAFALDAMLHLAAGVPFFGRKVRRGPVLYVAAESPAGIVARARAAIREKFHGRRLPFYVCRDIPRLGDEAIGLAELDRLLATADAIASAEREPLVACVWDTAAMLLAGSDENAAGMLQLAANARTFYERTGAAVNILHHPSKADPTGLRGHSSLAAAADVIIGISVDASGVRTAKVTKARDFEAGAEIYFRLQTVKLLEPDVFGDPTTTVIVMAGDTPLPAGVVARGANQQRVTEALREWARTHADTSVIDARDLSGLIKGCSIGRQRRPEVMEFLTRKGLLTASGGGHVINRALLT